MGNGVHELWLAARARELGYKVRTLGTNNQGEANEIGRELAELALSIRERKTVTDWPICVLSGGEPVVRLAPNGPRGKD